MVHAASAPSATDGSVLADALAIARYHIVLVAAAGTLVFGWLITGHRPWAIAALCGFDWFLINLMNRITDLDEDLRNGIPGTARVAERRRLLTVAAGLLLFGSFAVTHLVWPALTPWRLAVQAIGLGYNYRLVPTGRGWSRFKEIYFLKNFGSAVLFVLTCFAYPLAADPGARALSWPAIACLALFFIPFELTYEILYDLRDLPGDRAENIPTYPVVHGPARARRIIDALLLAAALVLAAGLLTRTIGLREGLLVVAPATQLAFYRPRFRRGLTSFDCILLTHLGTAQLLGFLAGTALWERLGLPPNIYL
ncbi:MAG: hypothetical protein EXR72_21350 [Myxococcales bacterium]|nr:hypothetical protein [Myxococcales bacterium]